jgi:hypothetical protein
VSFLCAIAGHGGALRVWWHCSGQKSKPKAEILDVILSAALFGWANRLMHTLGEPVMPAETD